MLLKIWNRSMPTNYYSTILSNSVNDDNEHDESYGVSVLTQKKKKTKRAPMYKVIILNDDYTPMEFVVAVLEQIFRMSRDQAVSLMLAVHNNGVGVAGVYVHEIAETKATQVMAVARKHEHPLQCVIEKE